MGKERVGEIERWRREGKRESDGVEGREHWGRSRAAVCFKSCAEETYLHLPKLKGTSTMHCCLEGV